MKRGAVAVTAALAFGAAGCNSILPFLGGTGAGILAAKKDADTALAVDAPLKGLWCRDRLADPGRGAARQAALEFYCAHIPTNVDQGIATWAGVLLILQAESRSP